MSFRQRVDALGGVLLMTIFAGATLWFGMERKLNLFIHPRYGWFAIGMAAVALVIAVAAMLAVRSHDQRQPTVVLVMLMIVSGVMAFYVNPSPLTAVTARQRVVNSAVNPSGQELQLLQVRGDYAHFTVKDWATLITRQNNPESYANKPVRVRGFVSADIADSKVFYVTRFMVSCCTLDARPIGVPVYRPNWRQKFKEDDWVEVGGVFAASPDRSLRLDTVIVPEYVQGVMRDADPYIY